MMDNLTQHIPDSAPFRALAIEGGGMRGYYAASLLNSLHHLFDNTLHTDSGKTAALTEKSNLICGTSTGAILACALAKGVPLSEIMDLYKNIGRKIFPSPMRQSFFWLLCHLYRSPAVPSALQKALQNIFKDETIGELYKKTGIALCIPTVNASDHRAWVFKTPHCSRYTRDQHYKVTDVCMASSAAPFLFPLHTVEHPHNASQKQYFADGCIWANNPILAALVESLQIADENQDIHILSIGTASPSGGNPKALQSAQWGISKWAECFFDMVISSQSVGYNGMAKLLANTLSNKTRKIKVMTLEGASKSPQQHDYVGVDRAGKNAINTMDNMASSDANIIHSKISNREIDEDVRTFFIPTQPGGNHGKLQ